MPESMPREQAERYTRALWFATIERDLTFQLGAEFADYWARTAWLSCREIADGFENWRAGSFPRAVDTDEE